MRKKSVRTSAALGLALIIFSWTAFGAEPQEIGIPYILAGAEGKLIPLERQRVNTSIRMKALGLGGGNAVMSFKGKASTVRVPSNGLKLTVRFAAMPPTPSSIVSIDSLETKKDSRQIVLTRVGPMGFGGKSTMGESEISLKFVPEPDSTLMIEPTTPFMPGEYALTLKDNPYAFLFAVSH